MASAGMKLLGFGSLVQTFERLQEAAEAAEGTWWVGTVVRYAPHLENGTAAMPAKPFFQPAVIRVGRETPNVKPRTINPNPRSGKSEWGLMVTGDPDGSVAQNVAERLERKVKEIIKEKELIDTGNLRASIISAPSRAKLERASFEAIPEEAETDDGRIVRREDIT